MKVLVACEESQVVCKAFRERGHEAYSCDIQECSGGHPEWHIQDDVMYHLSDGWDLMIAHPPCTYLSNAGARHLFAGGKLNQDRYKKGLLGKDLFMKMLDSTIPKRCIENPIPSSVFNLPRHTQQVNPYHFGHPFKKATRFWLRGLKPLMPTDILWKRVKYVHRGGCSVANGSVSSAKDRSKTFEGIAKAMAEQWG
jgi:hypothetical protein